jgi:enterochelin esterase-like enzyme
MTRARLLLLAAAVFICNAAGVAGADEPARPAPAPAGFTQIQQGPAGGTVWQGFVHDPEVAGQRRPVVVYLPPSARFGARYPVLYLLHGFPGSPWELVDGLHLADVADRLIARGRVRPFVAVMPPAGATVRFYGEWTGVWEREVVDLIVPWAERHLPVARDAADRALAGLSAGAYGAIDIGLRHPRLARTLESWSGYFRAPRDGSLAYATKRERAGHDPTLLVRREAAVLRRASVRIFLSSGTADRRAAASTRAFARTLVSERLPVRLSLLPGGHNGRLWRRQLPAALRFAFGIRGRSEWPASSRTQAAGAAPS